MRTHDITASISPAAPPVRRRNESREEMALREVGHTHVSRGTAATLVGVFLATIFAVPALQHGHEIRAALRSERNRLVPQAYDIFLRIPEAVDAFTGSDGNLWHRVVTANRQLLRDIHAYEDALEEGSILAHATLPKTQEVLCALGAGNEEAYPGRDRWLFYRPDIDHLTGPGFLEPKRLRQRADGGSEWQPAPHADPRHAILQFRDQLAARGIQLVVMPTPSKGSIHPGKFTSRISDGARAIQNASYARWIEELRAAGVRVFDPSNLIADARAATSADQYLATDTHWRPEAMELAAQGLADFIGAHATLPARQAPRHTVERSAISNPGDVAVMLRLPATQRRYRPESVSIHQVIDDHARLWRSDETSDVLLLGDSFSNIYSLEAMGWGESAGLAEHLSLRLQRPIDSILRNDDGAHATRAALARELAQGKDRLAGKRVVIWQFASRELTHGDWKLLDLAVGELPSRTFLVPSPGQTWSVTGVVEQVSAVPRPGSVPYRDHILSVHVSDLAGNDAGASGNAVVYLWSMRDNVWTPAARWRPGDTVRLRLRPWSDVASELDRFNRSELPEENLQMEVPCWGEPDDRR